MGSEANYCNGYCAPGCAASIELNFREGVYGLAGRGAVASRKPVLRPPKALLQTTLYHLPDSKICVNNAGEIPLTFCLRLNTLCSAWLEIFEDEGKSRSQYKFFYNYFGYAA